MHDLSAPSLERAGPSRVGPTFVLTYALAYMSIALMLLAPLLVTLSLKVRSLVGAEQAPASLALVTAIGGLLSMLANPFFGRLSDRTTSSYGMRRPWMAVGLVGGVVGLLVVAVAPSMPVVLLGWCASQVSFSALQATLVAVLPDQVPVEQRGAVSGVLGVTVPTAAVVGTFLVQLFEGQRLAMFLAPCAVGSVCVLWFAFLLDDRRLTRAARPSWSLRELAGAFWFDPRRSPDLAWAFAGRFLFMSGYAFLVTYQAYYLIDRLGSSESDVPGQVFGATLLQSVLLVAASLLGGRLTDRSGKRKVFVATAAVVFALALVVIALADTYAGFLVGMAVSGLGFGAYLAVDLALVTDVLPDPRDTAKDMGIFNIANALPFALAPAVAPGILDLSGGSYGTLYIVAGTCAVASALAVVPIRGAR